MLCTSQLRSRSGEEVGVWWVWSYTTSYLHIPKNWVYIFKKRKKEERMQTVWCGWWVLLMSLTAAAAPWAAFCWWQPHRCLWTSEKRNRRGRECRRNLVFLLKQGQGTPTSNLPPPNIDAITQPKGGRSIKERINDSNLISRDRDGVTPWETVRVSGDKRGTRGHVFCLLSKKISWGLWTDPPLLSPESLFCSHCYTVNLQSVSVHPQ